MVSIVYWALVGEADGRIDFAGGDNVKWFPVNHLPELAFDHRTIVEYAMNRLRGKIESPDIATRLVGERFTLSQLHDVYEAIAGQRIDLANFRRKMLASGLLEDTGEKLRSAVTGRRRSTGTAGSRERICGPKPERHPNRTTLELLSRMTTRYPH